MNAALVHDFSASYSSARLSPESRALAEALQARSGAPGDA
jgi:hypothetical protein